MQSAASSSFRAAGAMGDVDPEPGHAPQERLHCRKCGAFLPDRPTRTAIMSHVTDYHYTYDDQGNETGAVVDAEEPVEHQVRDCKRCGEANRD